MLTQRYKAAQRYWFVAVQIVVRQLPNLSSY